MKVSQATSEVQGTSLFPTTRWTSIFVPISERSPCSHEALERLFTIYRRPILSYVRRHMRDPQEAEDLTHDFIARLLRRDDLSGMDRSKGRFRGFLCASIRNFLASHYASLETHKRRDLYHAVPLDVVKLEPSHVDDGEVEFTREWWRTTIEEALRRLRHEWTAAGHEGLFEDLEPLMWDRKGGTRPDAIALKHNLTPNAVYLRKMRMRDRYGEILREVIAETVGSPVDVEDEIRFFLQSR